MIVEEIPYSNQRLYQSPQKKQTNPNSGEKESSNKKKVNKQFSIILNIDNKAKKKIDKDVLLSLQPKFQELFRQALKDQSRFNDQQVKGSENINLYEQNFIAMSYNNSNTNSVSKFQTLKEECPHHQCVQEIKKKKQMSMSICHFEIFNNQHYFRQNGNNAYQSQQYNQQQQQENNYQQNPTGINNFDIYNSRGNNGPSAQVLGSSSQSHIMSPKSNSPHNKILELEEELKRHRNMSGIAKLGHSPKLEAMRTIQKMHKEENEIMQNLAAMSSSKNQQQQPYKNTISEKEDLQELQDRVLTQQNNEEQNNNNLQAENQDKVVVPPLQQSSGSIHSVRQYNHSPLSNSNSQRGNSNSQRGGSTQKGIKLSLIRPKHDTFQQKNLHGGNYHTQEEETPCFNTFQAFHTQPISPKFIFNSSNTLNNQSKKKIEEKSEENEQTQQHQPSQQYRSSISSMNEQQQQFYRRHPHQQSQQMFTSNQMAQKINHYRNNSENQNIDSLSVNNIRFQMENRSPSKNQKTPSLFYGQQFDEQSFRHSIPGYVGLPYTYPGKNAQSTKNAQQKYLEGSMVSSQTCGTPGYFMSSNYMNQ